MSDTEYFDDMSVDYIAKCDECSRPFIAGQNQHCKPCKCLLS